MRRPERDEGPAAGAAGTLGAPAMAWQAAQILGADQDRDQLRHIRSEWAPRAPLAAALDLHEDTFARRARAVGVRTQLEVTPSNRCRVLYLVGDVRELMLGQEAAR